MLVMSLPLLLALAPSISIFQIYISEYTHPRNMNNLDATEAIASEVGENDGSVTIVDSSDAIISPPAGAENASDEEDELWNWAAEARLEDFQLEDLNFPTLQKPPEFWNNASQEVQQGAISQSPWAQFVKPNVAEVNTNLAPELKSLILWQSENNAGFKAEAGSNMMVQGPSMPDDDITIIHPPVGGEATANRKRKGIQVDDNYENNARFPTRASLTGSQAGPYQTRPGKKSNYSMNDKLMALHELVPGSQKADMATTLGETIEYLKQVPIREQILKEEIKQLRARQATGFMTVMRPSVQNYIQTPLGTPLSMGVHTQFGGMEMRRAVHPTMNMFNPMSARMNMPSVMQQNSAAADAASRLFVPQQNSAAAAASRLFVPQQNSAAAAASRLFVPPQVPEPSQQQRIVRYKIDDTQGAT